MCCRQTCMCLLWIALSLVAAVTSTTGFFSSDWIQGVLFDPMQDMRNVTAYMSSFRRCNFPQVNVDGQSFIAYSCGRYTSFKDIPTVWWQVTSVLTGLGSAISIYVAVRGVLGVCCAYVLDREALRILGRWQFVAACCMGAGLALFPMGWDLLEVQEICGYLSCPFTLGSCELGVSSYVLCSSIVCLMLCSCLSFCSSDNEEPP